MRCSREATQAAGGGGRGAGRREVTEGGPAHMRSLLSDGRPRQAGIMASAPPHTLAQGRMGRYSRAGPCQLAKAAGGLPHQVHGPPVGSQRKQHVVADLFVAKHLLLEGRSQRAVTSCPQGSWAPTGHRCHPILGEGPLLQMIIAFP